MTKWTKSFPGKYLVRDSGEWSMATLDFNDGLGPRTVLDFDVHFEPGRLDPSFLLRLTPDWPPACDWPDSPGKSLGFDVRYTDRSGSFTANATGRDAIDIRALLEFRAGLESVLGGAVECTRLTSVTRYLDIRVEPFTKTSRALLVFGFMRAPCKLPYNEKMDCSQIARAAVQQGADVGPFFTLNFAFAVNTVCLDTVKSDLDRLLVQV